MKFSCATAVLLVVLVFPFCVCRADWETEKIISDLISRMTVEEKVHLIAGKDMDTFPITRLGIPALKMADGPVGIRLEKSVSFPASVSMAASWDTDLIEKVGQALAREAKGKGRNMLLGPCVDIHRVPMAGRNFESFGEDPYLSGQMAAAYIKGVQEEHVIATVKHYAAYNQEWDRGAINVIVDERTLREIYLSAFEAAVKEGGSWSVMAAYNKVNGYHCTENNHLINEILKDEWGFKGFVISDWHSTHSTVNAANCGLDVEMPNMEFFNQGLVAALRSGGLKESVIDDKVRRVLRAMFFAGLFDKNASLTDSALAGSAENKEVSLQCAREGIVLLKNDKNILPIDLTRIKSIAVIGPNANTARTGGGGSSEVVPVYSVSPLEGLKEKIGNKATINYALGCNLDEDMIVLPLSNLLTTYNGEKVNGLLGEYFNNVTLQGEPVLRRVDSQINFDWQDRSPGEGVGYDDFSARWTAKFVPTVTGEIKLTIINDDGLRIWLDDKLIFDDWTDHGAEFKKIPLNIEANREYGLKVEYYERKGLAVARLGWINQKELLDEAVAVAKKSDLVIVFAGLSSGYEKEGLDRPNMDLPDNQNLLIEKVYEVNKNTIVVLNTGSPVMIRWADRIPAIVEAWFPGEGCGWAIADVLLGNYNPGGKLPTTFPIQWEDCPAYGNFPGANGRVNYAEGIFVGYRHFDKKNIKVLFPFGYGLSYTTFGYSNIKILPGTLPNNELVVDVSADITNTGTRKGAEVVQLYISDKEASVERPPKELKGFARVVLKPGETKTVNFRLDKRSMAFYDLKKKDWVAEPGEFEVLIGSSSKDIHLKGTFVLTSS
ncbi:MAG: glycoside hydrolase family 3 C-terminal domain-containing protein [Candidatus Omnitrophota bacterium]